MHLLDPPRWATLRFDGEGGWRFSPRLPTGLSDGDAGPGKSPAWPPGAKTIAWGKKLLFEYPLFTIHYRQWQSPQQTIGLQRCGNQCWAVGDQQPHKLSDRNRLGPLGQANNGP